jgi:sensor histidine kinase YesM
LEHARFKDQFEYTFIVDQELENSDYELPPMMVQPFIENAIWHGLRYRSGKGALEVNFKKVGENIEITISDNGIGMTKSKELKTQHQKKQNSLGMKNIHTRLALMNEIYNAGMTVEISETFAGAENPGATVKIRIPQLKLSENSKTR